MLYFNYLTLNIKSISLYVTVETCLFMNDQRNLLSILDLEDQIRAYHNLIIINLGSILLESLYEFLKLTLSSQILWMSICHEEA